MAKPKDVDFFIGNSALFIDQEALKLYGGNQRLCDFVSLFECENDRYYAYALFEEKPTLLIKQCDDDFATTYAVPEVYDKSKTLYNLLYEIDGFEFFIEALSELSHLKRLCNYFEFNYEFHGISPNC